MLNTQQNASYDSGLTKHEILAKSNYNCSFSLAICSYLCCSSTSANVYDLAGVPISTWASSSKKILSSKSPTDSTYSSYSLLTDLLVDKTKNQQKGTQNISRYQYLKYITSKLWVKDLKRETWLHTVIWFYQLGG